MMSRRRAAVGALTVLSLLMSGLSAGACQSKETLMTAENARLTVEDVTGYWALTGGDDGNGDCRLALQPTRVDGGHGVLVEACGLPEVAGAARWRLAGAVFELMDGAGGVLVVFTPRGPDAYDGRAPSGAAYRLERAPVV